MTFHYVMAVVVALVCGFLFYGVTNDIPGFQYVILGCDVGYCADEQKSTWTVPLYSVPVWVLLLILTGSLCQRAIAIHAGKVRETPNVTSHAY